MDGIIYLLNNLLGPVVYPPQVTCDMHFVPVENSNGTDTSNIMPERLPEKVW